jgi:glycosyltransferase involved in cell wall biosynthesis
VVMRIAWLGPVIDESDANGLIAFSPAANEWQLGLATALQRLGSKLTVIGHVPQSAWPNGPLWASGRGMSVARKLDGSIAGYCNLPVLRMISRGFEYKRLLRKHLAHGRFDYVFTYNADPAQIDAARDARRRYGSRWICVHADGAPVEGSDGYIVLNWQCAEAARARAKVLHVDGGVDYCERGADSAEANPGKARHILYAGAWTRFSGAFALVRAFRQLREPDVRLHLCGPGDRIAIEREIGFDRRIVLHGLLARDVLDSLMRSATMFVNPRPMTEPLNRFNFPSKLLCYLAYARPIVSTRCHGLAPEYDEVLEYSAGEHPSQLADTISQTLRWEHDRYATRCRLLDQFARSRSWEMQARRVMDWLTTVPL